MVSVGICISLTVIFHFGSHHSSPINYSPRIYFFYTKSNTPNIYITWHFNINNTQPLFQLVFNSILHNHQCKFGYFSAIHSIQITHVQQQHQHLQSIFNNPTHITIITCIPKFISSHHTITILPLSIAIAIVTNSPHSTQYTPNSFPSHSSLNLSVTPINSYQFKITSQLEHFSFQLLLSKINSNINANTTNSR